MKMRTVLVFFLLVVFLWPTQSEASHDLASSYLDSVVPKTGFDQWTEKEEKEVKALQKIVTNHLEAYHNAVIERANELWDENPFQRQIEVRTSAKSYIPDAATELQKTYFGSYENFFEGSGYKGSKGDDTFERTVRKLYEEYGVITHVHMSDWQHLCIMSCESYPILFSSPYVYNTKQFDIDILTGHITSHSINTSSGDFSVFEAVATGQASSLGKKVVVASEGFFTQNQIDQYGGCNVLAAKESLQQPDGENGEPRIGSPNVIGVEGETPLLLEKSVSSDNSLKNIITTWKTDKISSGLKNLFVKLNDAFTGTLFGTNCDKNSLSAVSQFSNISRPLNLTNNPYIMKLVHITQQIGFTMAIVIIAFYALMFTTGFQNMDPIKFGIRLFFCLLAVQYLPYLMQDVLNLNNLVVYNLSTLQFSFNEVAGNSTDILMGGFVALWEGLLSSEKVFEHLLVLLFMFMMAIIALVPLLQIIVWWYIRLLRIFLGAIIGPIMVMLAALPQTAEPASEWLEKYIGTVFQQIFMAIGLLLVSVLIGNIGEFAEIIRIGWFGKAVLIYAAIFFLADIPDFSRSFFEAFRGGDAKDYSKGMTKAASKFSGFNIAKKAGKTAVSHIAKKGLAGAAQSGGSALKKTGGTAAGGLGSAAGAQTSRIGRHTQAGKMGSTTQKTQTGKMDSTTQKTQTGQKGFQSGKQAQQGLTKGLSGNASSASGSGETKTAPVGNATGSASVKAHNSANSFSRSANKKESQVVQQAKSDAGLKKTALKNSFNNASSHIKQSGNPSKPNVSNVLKQTGQHSPLKNGTAKPYTHQPQNAKPTFQRSNKTSATSKKTDNPEKK